MAEEFHLFLERYKTNVEFLELQNDDDFSGVELLKQGVQDIYGWTSQQKVDSFSN